MKKEIVIYSTIFVVLSLLIHFEQWLNNPLLHLSNLESSGAYGLGITHPFIFTLLIYIILFIPRLIVKLFINKTQNK